MVDLRQDQYCLNLFLYLNGPGKASRNRYFFISQKKDESGQASASRKVGGAGVDWFANQFYFLTVWGNIF